MMVDTGKPEQGPANSKKGRLWRQALNLWVTQRAIALLLLRTMTVWQKAQSYRCHALGILGIYWRNAEKPPRRQSWESYAAICETLRERTM